MIILHERMLPEPVGIEPATPWSPVGHASDRATEAYPSIQTDGPEQTMYTQIRHRRTRRLIRVYAVSTHLATGYKMDLESILGQVC